MPNTVTLTERFPTWAAASAARNRLAQSGGFSRYGIADASIDRIGSEFALVIHTDEAHRNEIDALLRSSGTMFNRPLGQRSHNQPGLTSPIVIFGIGAVLGAVLFTWFTRRHRGRDQPTLWREEGLWEPELSRDLDRWHAGRDDEQEWQHQQLERDQRAGLRSHAEGYAV